MGLFTEKKKKSSLSVVIVAAGTSSRMGYNKIFSDLAGKKVIERTVEAFNCCEVVCEIVVVVKQEDIEKASKICLRYNKVVKVICGGQRRVDSVLNGVLETDRHSKLVAVHDGARPLISQKIISDTVNLALETGAAIPAIPVTDTIKVSSDSGKIIDTPVRSNLYAVQTPQIFNGDILKGALTKAVQEDREVTDDSMAVEAIGVPVYLSEGDAENIKLTRPIDFITAEGIIRAHEDRTRL